MHSFTIRKVVIKIQLISGGFQMRTLFNGKELSGWIPRSPSSFRWICNYFRVKWWGEFWGLIILIRIFDNRYGISSYGETSFHSSFWEWKYRLRKNGSEMQYLHIIGKWSIALSEHRNRRSIIVREIGRFLCRISNACRGKERSRLQVICVLPGWVWLYEGL